MRRQILAVSLLTGLAQLAGFAKLWVTARLFGVGAELDGYFLALVAPTFLNGLLAGMVQAGLFPVRARLYASGDRPCAEQLERWILCGMAAIGLALSLGLLFAQSYWLPWIAKETSPDVMLSMERVIPFAAWLIALNAIGSTAGYLLAIRNRYWVAAGAPIGNACVGTTLLLAWPEGRLINLAIGTLLGYALEAAICLFALTRLGFAWRSTTSVSPRVQKAMGSACALAISILPAILLTNFASALPPVLVSGYGDGAVSAFGYAQRLHQAAFSVLVMAVSPVLFATFSALVAEKRDATIKATLVKAGCWSALIGLFAPLAVMGLGPVMLEYVLRGRFDEVAAQRVSTHWFWLTVGLGFLTFGNVLGKLWQGMGRNGLLGVFAAVQLIGLITAYHFLKPVGETAVAIAITASVILTIAVNIAVLVRWWSLAPASSTASEKKCGTKA